MIKGRYNDENLKWIPLIIIAVFALPFLLKSATFSYKYYLYVINMAGIYIILTVGLDLLRACCIFSHRRIYFSYFG